jgi:hypothetical protein
MPIECRSTTYFIGDPDILSKTCNTGHLRWELAIYFISKGCQSLLISECDGLSRELNPDAGLDVSQEVSIDFSQEHSQFHFR